MAVRFDPDLLAARRAFPMSQALLAGEPLRELGVVDVGWHDTNTHPETGAFAVVAIGAEFGELRGEILRVSAGDRVAFVYVVAERAVPAPISLARRAFLHLGLLSTERLSALVNIVDVRAHLGEPEVEVDWDGGVSGAHGHGGLDGGMPGSPGIGGADGRSP